MYRQIQNKIEVNFLHDTGGLGDHIASLPVYKYIFDNHPHITMNIWLPDYMVDLAIRSLPKDPRIVIRGFKDSHLYDQKLTGRAFAIHRHTNLGYHTTKYSFNILLNEEVEEKHLNYLQPDVSNIDIKKFNLPEKYVVVTTGFTAEVREFLSHYVNQVVEYINKKGYEVVFLGKQETSVGYGDKIIRGAFKNEIDYTKGINLLDKTSLVEAQKIISQSHCVVALDNGLMHLAGTTNTAIVGGFTTVKPEHRMPYRYDRLGWNFYSVVPPDSLACRFCQSNWQFTFKHDFRNCYYVENKQDTEIQCTKQLTPILYINELEKIL